MFKKQILTKTHQKRCRRGPGPLQKDAPWKMVPIASGIIRYTNFMRPLYGTLYTFYTDNIYICFLLFICIYLYFIHIHIYINIYRYLCIYVNHMIIYREWYIYIYICMHICMYGCKITKIILSRKSFSNHKSFLIRKSL